MRVFLHGTDYHKRLRPSPTFFVPPCQYERAISGGFDPGVSGYVVGYAKVTGSAGVTGSLRVAGGARDLSFLMTVALFVGLDSNADLPLA